MNGLCSLATLSWIAGVQVAPGDRIELDASLCDLASDEQIRLVKQCARDYRVVWRIVGAIKPPRSRECVDEVVKVPKRRRK
jgi:hypothetical protein